MQSDSVGLEGGDNSFVYVGNNPLVRVDESGLLTVYVWNFRGSKEAWGHSAMTLEDGTHISWWPKNGAGLSNFWKGRGVKRGEGSNDSNSILTS